MPLASTESFEVNKDVRSLLTGYFTLCFSGPSESGTQIIICLSLAILSVCQLCLSVSSVCLSALSVCQLCLSVSSVCMSVSREVQAAGAAPLDPAGTCSRPPLWIAEIVCSSASAV
jgi:hypothetical protein